MAIDVHTVSLGAGSDAPANPDRLMTVIKKAVANGVGSAAGAAVAIAITGLQLPASYAVFVTPSQDARWFISGRTRTGFTVNLLPGIATNTLAAGTFDLLVLA